jgi:hypothetical protein
MCWDKLWSVFNLLYLCHFAFSTEENCDETIVMIIIISVMYKVRNKSSNSVLIIKNTFPPFFPLLKKRSAYLILAHVMFEC